MTQIRRCVLLTSGRPAVFTLILIPLLSAFCCNAESNSTQPTTTALSNNEKASSNSNNSSKIALTNGWENIEGCPDYASFNVSLVRATELAKITCICGPPDISTADEIANISLGISLNCIYGSTLTDFKNALNAAVAAKRTVEKMTLSGILLSENDAHSVISIIRQAYKTEIPVKTLEIKTCHGEMPSKIFHENSTNQIQLPKLEHLLIEYCDLNEMPTNFIDSSSALRRLSLSNNKIKRVRTADLAIVSTTLEQLNLEGNLLNSVENGAFAQLKKLRTLRIGEHNFANSDVIEEIERIPQLEHLDMTRMDGVDDKNFFNSKTIKTLTLTGCNFKNISRRNFANMSGLEELDLRVNLIEQIEPNSFVGLNKLHRLNLAGNFLRHVNDSNVWRGLNEIKHVDLGWNDFIRLNATTFKSLNAQVEILDLRHSEKLKMIEDNTFVQFNRLAFLNLSHSAINEIHNQTLTMTNVKVLDLSYNNISFIDAGAFNGIKINLEYLNISDNQLTEIPDSLLLEIPNLKELDLSNNPWVCDQSMRKVRDVINQIYKYAAANSNAFELRNEKMTVCHRPYSKKGLSIFQLEDEDFNYDKALDVTTLPPSTTIGSVNDTDDTTTAINWQQVTIQVGEDENALSVTDEDAGKPTYDINTIRYGQRTYKKLSNTWLSAVIVGILICLTTVCVILIARRKKTRMVKNDITCTATSTQL